MQVYKEKYNQIIDEVYENFLMISKKMGSKDENTSKVEFINKIQTDERFSKYWGLKIEERELSLDERKQIFDDRGYVCDVWPFNGDWHGEYDGFRIPRRAISLTYNNEIIEIYE